MNIANINTSLEIVEVSNEDIEENDEDIDINEDIEEGFEDDGENDNIIDNIIGKETFFEKVNVLKLKYIIDNIDIFDDIIKKQEKDYNVLMSLIKIYNSVKIPEELEGTEYGILEVRYKKGKTSNGKGRWYAYNSIGIQPLIACVRHTICNGLWVDIDQVNSHPTIFRYIVYMNNSDVGYPDGYDDWSSN